MGLNFKSHRIKKLRLQMVRSDRPLPKVGVCGATPEIIGCEIENRFKRRYAAIAEFLAIGTLSEKNVVAARKAVVQLREDYGEDLDKQILIARLDELAAKAYDRMRTREEKRAASETPRKEIKKPAAPAPADLPW